MANTIRLRVRGPEGVIPITTESTASWSSLLHEISEKTGVPDFDTKYGYPPQSLNTESIDGATHISDLPVKLDGEQLIIMPRNLQNQLSRPMSNTHPPPQAAGLLPPQNTSAPAHQPGDFPDQPLNLTRKQQYGDVESDPPEVPVPALDGALVLRVMPDDNSCMFRALSSAVLGSALDGMTELRSVVAQTIQAQPELYLSLIHI